MRQVFLILFSLFPFCFFAHDTLVISDTTSNLSLDEYITANVDVEGVYSESDFIDGEIPVKSIESSDISVRVGTKQIWYCFYIKNECRSARSFIVCVDNSEINILNFYEFEGDSLRNRKNTGEWTPRDENDYYRDFTYAINLKPGATKKIGIYADNNYEAIVSRVQLFTDRQYAKYHDKDTFSMAIIFGILFILILFALNLYIRLKNLVFLYATLYFLFGTLVISNIFGFYKEYLFPDSPLFTDYSRIVLIYLTAYFSMLFMYEFLDLKKYFSGSKVKIVNNAALGIMLVGCVFSIVPFPYRIIGLVSYLPFVLAILVYTLYWSIRVWRMNPLSAKTVVFSCIPLFVCIFLMLLRNNGIITVAHVMIGFQYAFTLQMTIIAFGLIEMLRRQQLTLLDDLKDKNKHIEHQKFILSQKNFELETLSIASSKTNNSIAIYNKDGNIKWYNEEFINTYNAVIRQVFSKKLRNITNLIPNENIKLYFQSCSQKVKPISFETMIARKDGETRFYQTTLSPITNETGKITNFVTIDSDITKINETIQKNKDLQNRLMQMEKLESIGKLAGGIAHDFNNLLTPIVGFSELILLDQSLSDESKEDLKAIKASASRAKKLVNQILVFSNYFKPEIKVIEIKSIIEEVVTFLSSSLPANISFSQTLCEDNLCIEADSTHIHQVIMNICKNAIQAISDNSGNVELLLDCVHEFSVGNIDGTIVGDYALIQVADTGEGMSADTIKKMFDPFFTTKSANQGTGLGMSVVHGIVAKYDGYINVDSEKGKGTIISIYLPISTSETSEGAIGQDAYYEEAGRFRGNGENIMIIDDEKAILKMMSRLLENNNYSVATFSDSQEAIDAFNESPQKWDLILTDQTMPKFTGDALSKMILKTEPLAKIILMTGYSEDVNEELASNLGIKKLILKPINSEYLLNTISTILK